jgi:hypothetical protein
VGSDVAIGWVTPGTVRTEFVDSLLRTVGYDQGAGGQRIAGWNGVTCSANVSAGRNALVEWFLASPAQWLMTIDSDMVWQPDAVHQLLAAADVQDRPLVGGLCFGRDGDTGMVWPTMYDITGTPEEPQFVRYDSWPPDDLFPVLGTGAAFLLAHRRVFEAIAERGFSKAYPWFQETALAGMRVGEDMTLCMRAAQVGIPTHVHTGVHIGHCKDFVLTVEAYRGQQMMLAAVREQEATADAHA